MNRELVKTENRYTAVPRMRGDEPYIDRGTVTDLICSPHARG